MTALVLSVLGASLLGSAHCAGMCGGFVCFYAGDGKASRAWAHVAYNGGRLASYVALGLAAGALGHGLDRAGALAGVARAAALAAGAFIALWGSARLLGALRPAPGPAPVPGAPPRAASGLASRARVAWPARAIGHALVRLRAAPAWVRALSLGLLTTLLPCGWLYAFVATAAGTGSPGRGALVMAAFWAGTVPALAALGVVARGALGPFARRLPLVTSALLVVVGLLTLGNRLAPGHAAHRHAGGAALPAAAAEHAGPACAPR